MNLDQMYADKENRYQELKRNHAMFDAWYEEYLKTDKLLEGMEKQVESDKWRELK